MAMTFQLVANGELQFSRTLLRIGERMLDASPAFENIADTLAAENLKNFTSQGGYASGTWSPLSPKYRKWKTKHYPGQPILVLTGQLRKDLTQRPFGYEHITANTLDVGSLLPYAKYHQAGTGVMPRRRPIELTSAARKAMAKTLQKFLITGEL